MQKPENKFIGKVHSHLAKWVYREKQNNPYRGGAPDVYYESEITGSGPGYLRAEYKWLPAKNPTYCDPWNKQASVRLSGLQREWLKRTNQNGHPGWVIVGWSEGVIILPTPDSDPITDIKAASRTIRETALQIENFLLHGEVPLLLSIPIQ